jgi:L-rhamnose isomerase
MENMVLLGVLVDPDTLGLSMAETTALSVLSTAIITGHCVCGGEWETVEDDTGNIFPTIMHSGNCPGTSRSGQDAVKKVLKHIVHQALSDE